MRQPKHAIVVMRPSVVHPAWPGENVLAIILPKPTRSTLPPPKRRKRVGK